MGQLLIPIAMPLGPAFEPACPSLCRCCDGSWAYIGDGKRPFIARWGLKSRGNQVREESLF